MYAVDFYIEHSLLEAVMNDRKDRAWKLVKICDVVPKTDSNFVTLIWESAIEPAPEVDS